MYTEVLVIPNPCCLPLHSTDHYLWTSPYLSPSLALQYPYPCYSTNPFWHFYPHNFFFSYLLPYSSHSSYSHTPPPPPRCFLHLSRSRLVVSCWLGKGAIGVAKGKISSLIYCVSRTAMSFCHWAQCSSQVAALLTLDPVQLLGYCITARLSMAPEQLCHHCQVQCGFQAAAFPSQGPAHLLGCCIIT